jgi:class 3 adenylate cyclase
MQQSTNLKNIRRKSIKRLTNPKKLLNIQNSQSQNSDNEDDQNSINILSSKSKIVASNGLSHSTLSHQSKRPLWKKRIAKFLDSAPVLIFMSILTVYALFAADVQAAWCRVNIDYGFNVLQCILIGIFLLEWIFNIISKIDYTWSFFFWLDLVATISLLQDLDWVINPIMGYGSARQRSFKSSVQAAKAMSKVSSASRATRVLRVIRIVRLIRMVKLYKSVITAREIQARIKKQQDLEAKNKIEKNIESNDTTLTKKDYIIGRGSINPSINNDNKDSSSISVNSDSINGENNNEQNNNEQNNNDKKDNDKKDNDIKDENNNEQNNNDIKYYNIKDENKNDNNNIKDDNKNDTNNNKNNIKNDNKKDDIANGNNFPTEVEKRNTVKETENNLLITKDNKNTNNNEQDNEDEKIKDIFETPKEDIATTTNHHNISIDDMDEEELEKVVKESRISKIISDSLTQKVIILILILLIVFPILSDDFFVNTSITYELIAQIISASYDLFESQNKILQSDVLYQLFDKNFPALNISYNGTLLYNDSYYWNKTDYFRYKEVTTVFSADGQVNIVYSLLKETQLTGLLNIFQTIFVCIMLSGAAILFENDAKKLVLSPLEIMIEIVDNVAKDPINAKNIDELQTGVKAILDEEEGEKEKAKKKKHGNLGNNATVALDDKNNNDEEENYEVSVIKAAIIKISALLAISFGEAGGEIIKKNLTSGQDLNPRLKGKKKTAIFGFCDIRQFEEINLALEEKTILLINEIADIVHSSVDKFGGATNKNIGESFLNVWKFYNEVPVRDKDGNLTTQKKDNLLEIDPTNPMVAITADSACLACLRVIMKINKSFNILNYSHNEEILKRISNFKLNMGFGIHIGYGIEGAVGSTYKIDASYLSPNVNIAARLETATRQFGLSLLISGPLYNLFSDELKRICRYIDCVYVKGSVQPLDLYTIDVNLNLKPQEKKDIIIMNNKEKRKRYAEKKENFQREIEVYKSVTRLVFQKSNYLELINTKRTSEFYYNWDEGINAYKKGDFTTAGDKFKRCLKLFPDDGPAKTLLKYFENRNYKAPEGWIGVRELTSK